MIYGVGTLAACMLLGKLIGNLLGLVTGTGSDVGGVGFAMVLLMLITNSKKLKFVQSKGFEQGIGFWKGMYIPVVTAMAASQNVYSAFSKGFIAIAAGILAVLAGFALIPLIGKIGAGKTE